MPAADDLIVIYLELAHAARKRNRPWDRDKLLLLAGATAEERGRHTIASLCRRRILEHNHGHMIGHYAKFSDALADERFAAYLAQLRRRFTPERCEHMLTLLRIDLRERLNRYADLNEYAATTLRDEQANDGSK